MTIRLVPAALAPAAVAPAAAALHWPRRLLPLEPFIPSANRLGTEPFAAVAKRLAGR